MNIKVQGGTTTDPGEGLCNTCRNGTVVKGQALNERIVQCAAVEISNIPFAVTSCTSYNDKRFASKHEMESIAWVLVTRGAGRQVGFIRAKELKKFEQRYGTPDDD